MKNLAGNEKGQGLVEMALVLPILILLFMGIFEFGRIMGSFMVINNLARDGVRYGVVGHNDMEIEELIVAGHSWLDEDNLEVSISPVFSDREKGEPLEVRIDYSVDLVTPLISDVLPNPVPLSAQCSMRVEY